MCGERLEGKGDHGTNLRLGWKHLHCMLERHETRNVRYLAITLYFLVNLCMSILHAWKRRRKQGSLRPSTTELLSSCSLERREGPTSVKSRVWGREYLLREI